MLLRVGSPARFFFLSLLGHPPFPSSVMSASCAGRSHSVVLLVLVSGASILLTAFRMLFGCAARSRSCSLSTAGLHLHRRLFGFSPALGRRISGETRPVSGNLSGQIWGVIRRTNLASYLGPGTSATQLQFTGTWNSGFCDLFLCV
jgi:hypothetical protein